MYGELEILRMVSKLHHAELIEAAQQQQLLKCQQASQADRLAPRSPLVNWIGIQLVTLGYRLLADQPPEFRRQWQGMDKCLGC
ncbi:MAG: hypothetical protein NT075_06795 [Chloroflexi bacterium]|nr:hypothetical protein [Chloroflexota bacterium]